MSLKFLKWTANFINNSAWHLLIFELFLKKIILIKKAHRRVMSIIKKISFTVFDFKKRERLESLIKTSTNGIEWKKHKTKWFNIFSQFMAPARGTLGVCVRLFCLLTDDVIATVDD